MFNANAVKKVIPYVIAAGAVVACHLAIREKRENAKKINSIVNDLSKKTEIEVSEEIVNAAVEKASEEAVAKAIKETTEKISKDVSAKVWAAIKLVYDDVEVEATEKFKKALEVDFDADEMRKRVEKAVTRKIAQEIMENADDYFGPIISRLVNNIKK